MFIPSIRAYGGSYAANDIVRDTNPDVRAYAAGQLAWWAAYLHHVRDCDAYCEPGCNNNASDIADTERDAAIARVYARAQRDAMTPAN